MALRRQQSDLEDKPNACASLRDDREKTWMSSWMLLSIFRQYCDAIIIGEGNDKEDLLSGRYTIYYVQEARVEWRPLIIVETLKAPAERYPEYYYMMKNTFCIQVVQRTIEEKTKTAPYGQSTSECQTTIETNLL